MPTAPNSTSCPTCGRALDAAGRCPAWRCNRQAPTPERDRALLGGLLGVLRGTEQTRAAISTLANELATSPISEQTPAIVVEGVERAAAPLRAAFEQLAGVRRAESKPGAPVELHPCPRCGVWTADPCQCGGR